MASRLRRFTKKTFIFLNLLVAILFLLGSYNYLFNPDKFWFLGFLTLGLFYLLLLLAVFLFFWLMVKPAYMFISIIAMLLAWTPMRHLVKFRTHHFSLVKDSANIRIMSWNVQHFEVAEHKIHPEKKQQMLDIITRYKPDLACFQEVVAGDSAISAINYLPELLRSMDMPYYFFSYNPKLDYDKDHRFGILIVSKYPLVHKTTVSQNPKDYNSIFQYVDMTKGKDTIRVFNMHLQSLHFSDKDRQYLDDPEIENDSDIKKGKSIASKFKAGFLRRRQQSDVIADEISSSPYPVIVCGDFNDVPNSYAYHRIGAGLQNAFAVKGSGIGRTFSDISPTLRIDNIFAGPQFKVMQFDRYHKKISDHFPIVSDLYHTKQ